MPSLPDSLSAVHWTHLDAELFLARFEHVGSSYLSSLGGFVLVSGPGKASLFSCFFFSSIFVIEALFRTSPYAVSLSRNALHYSDARLLRRNFALSPPTMPRRVRENFLFLGPVLKARMKIARSPSSFLL